MCQNSITIGPRQPSRPGTTTRKSNMEALRIIAMSMILVYHIMLHGLTPDNIPNNLYYAFRGFVYSGVNIFFLLSGYFTIRYSIRGLIKLIITLLSFGIINLLLALACGVQIPIYKWITVLLYPISASPYWFMKIYFLLYISAPILNAGLEYISKPQLRHTLLITLIVLFYYRADYASYSYLQGFYLYCIGYYLKSIKSTREINQGGGKILWLFYFFISCIIYSVMYYLSASGFRIFNYFVSFDSYQTPMIFISAICLLMYFSSISFTSRTINFIASFSLGCYLLQDGFFGHSCLYKYIFDFTRQYGYGLKLFGLIITIFFSYWIGSLIITSLNNLYITNLSAFAEKVARRVWIHFRILYH